MTLQRGDWPTLEKGMVLWKGLEDRPPTGRAHAGENLGWSSIISPHALLSRANQTDLEISNAWTRPPPADCWHALHESSTVCMAPAP